jgi:hypothetical protein
VLGFLCVVEGKRYESVNCPFFVGGEHSLELDYVIGILHLLEFKAEGFKGF